MTNYPHVKNFYNNPEAFFDHLLKICLENMHDFSNLLALFYLTNTVYSNDGKFDQEVFNKLFFEMNVSDRLKKIVKNHLGNYCFFDDSGFYDDKFYKRILSFVDENPESIKTLEETSLVAPKNLPTLIFPCRTQNNWFL